MTESKKVLHWAQCSVAHWVKRWVEQKAAERDVQTAYKTVGPKALEMAAHLGWKKVDS